MRYKHQRYQGGLLMVNYACMYIRSQKGIKARMETPGGLYGKGNMQCINKWALMSFPVITQH
jgi:hypothetical protein